MSMNWIAHRIGGTSALSYVKYSIARAEQIAQGLDHKDADNAWAKWCGKDSECDWPTYGQRLCAGKDGLGPGNLCGWKRASDSWRFEEQKPAAYIPLILILHSLRRIVVTVCTSVFFFINQNFRINFFLFLFCMEF